MNVIDLKEAVLSRLITHHIGSISREGKLILSSEETRVSDGDTERFLQSYFLDTLKTDEVFEFCHSIDLSHNTVYTLVNNLFADEGSFISLSNNLATLLYEKSTHPQIKDGKLSVVIFNHIRYGDELVRGIGLFKSETTVPFLQLHEAEEFSAFGHEYGFELKGIDKACLILENNQEGGYSVLIRDTAGKNKEAQYWVDDFLHVQPSANEYNLTKQFMALTKDFVVTQASEEFMLSPTDKIDVLNKTMEYFKENEEFDKEEFTDSIFSDTAMKESFLEFDTAMRPEQESDVNSRFEISPKAVRSQNSVYKSVLKLDKNFHIYIHGDKSLIQRGTEPDGRKFYKIYYENET